MSSLTRLRQVAGTKSLPPEYARAVHDAVQQLMAGPDGPKSQHELAAAIGIPQPQLSTFLAKGGSGGFGIHALIALSRYTGRGIDDLLGREAEIRRAPPDQVYERLRTLHSLVRELFRLLGAAGVTFGPESPIGKVVAKIEELDR
jgi:hypothetical protein